MNINATNTLLSICIPTRGRLDFLRPTLNSLFSSTVDPSLYEVVIYDSSEDDNLELFILENYNQPNLVYRKGSNNGFLNLITALKMGSGAFLKLHNDYSILYSGSLEKMIALIENNINTKPLVFFANDNLKVANIENYTTFNSFLYKISYFSSWSTAFGMWKSDFERSLNIEINPMFPHTSLMFAMTNKSHYLIYNEKIFNNQEVANKGGYNLFRTFAVEYLSMLEKCVQNKSISANTFAHIKFHLFKSFLVDWYCNTKILKNSYTYDLSNIKGSMQVYYSTFLYYAMIVFSYIRAVAKKLKSFYDSLKTTAQHA